MKKKQITRKDFLRAYIKDYLWIKIKAKNIPRFLCENYYYQSKESKDRSFQMTAFGWLWGKTDYFSANVETALLEKEMEEIYKIVAKERKWG